MKPSAAPKTQPGPSPNILKRPNNKYTLPLQWQGALWKMLACACFAGINVYGRYLSGGAGEAMNPLPAYEIICLQYTFAALFLAPWILKKGIKTLYTKQISLQTIRILSAVIGLYLWYLAIHFLPLVQAVALAFTGPIFTLIGATLYLKEKLTKSRLTAISLGLIGAFIICRPDKPFFDDTITLIWSAAILFPLLSAIGFAFAKISGRQLAANGESATTMTAFLMFFIPPLTFVLGYFLTDWVTPTLSQITISICLGALAVIAQLAMARSFALAEITFLAPFGFMRLLLTAFFGFLWFNEIPDQSVIIGTIIITASVMLLSRDKQASLLAP